MAQGPWTVESFPGSGLHAVQSRHLLVPGASQTICKVLVRWMLHLEPQESVSVSSLGLRTSVSSHISCVSTARTHSLPTECPHSGSPPCAKVLSVFKLILRNAYLFTLAGKIKCKVPRDWFVKSCPLIHYLDNTVLNIIM